MIDIPFKIFGKQPMCVCLCTFPIHHRISKILKEINRVSSTNISFDVKSKETHRGRCSEIS